MFKQVADQVLSIKPMENLLLSKTWKIKLQNEAADDAGGVFDEVLTHMCIVRSALFSLHFLLTSNFELFVQIYVVVRNLRDFTWTKCV